MSSACDDVFDSNVATIFLDFTLEHSARITYDRSLWLMLNPSHCSSKGSRYLFWTEQGILDVVARDLMMYVLVSTFYIARLGHLELLRFSDRSSDGKSKKTKRLATAERHTSVLQFVYVRDFFFLAL